MNLRFRFLWLMLLCAFFACKNKTTEVAPPKVDESIPGNFSSQTEKKFDSLELQQFIDSFPALRPINDEILSFYRSRNFAFAWFDSTGMIEPASNLFNRIKNISDDGIDSSKLLYQSAFNHLMENHTGKPGDSLSTLTELMLTSQYLMYAKAVWTGIDEDSTLSLQWLLPRKKLDYQQLLDSIISGSDVLNDPPVYRQYYLLKDYLKKYRQQETFDTAKFATNLSFKKSDSSSIIAGIKQKLFYYGDLPSAPTNGLFDEQTVAAVKSFQERMGLKATGTIQKSTLEELNIPLHNRVEQIIVNMERSRWVTKDAGANYIIVNIPEYKLHVIENDTLAWEMNVVVGKNQSKTVVFNGDIKYVVFAPYWNVPQSILKSEVLPGIKRNSNYLARHNMEWNGGSVRQKPGPNNSLGLVKFLFPNSHSIYLHDSPAKSLFNETDRAFSHGCIRLAEPQRLAEYLLRKDTSWNTLKIKAAMNAGKERYVTLKQTVPVFIVYFTAWVSSRDGKLQFRKDIYQRDSRLEQMILK
jgi:murein L,D-transpeptidase YcbB/YkuD